MEIGVLEEFNPWWFGGGVPPELSPPYRRPLFTELERYLPKRQALVLTGLRRVGKSTLLYQLADSLIAGGLDPRRILYFSFDERAGGLSEVMDSYREYTQADLRKDRVCVILDEVQRLEGWAFQVKKFYDLYPRLKFLASGSESVFLQEESRNALAGRSYEFLLKPLSFTEFIELKGRKAANLSVSQAKALFNEFIGKGGFPELVAEGSARAARDYIRSAVVEKVVYRDIPGLAKIREPELLKILLELVAASPGLNVNYQSLAQQLGFDRRVIQQYFSWLEKSFLVRLLANYRGSRISRLRKIKKAYPADTGITSAYSTAAPNSELFAKMVENAVINAVGAEFFWRNQHEVDAVVAGVPFEVKYQGKIISSDLRGAREFMRTFNQKTAFVITLGEERETKVPEGTVILKPAWKMLLETQPKVLQASALVL